MHRREESNEPGAPNPGDGPDRSPAPWGGRASGSLVRRRLRDLHEELVVRRRLAEPVVEQLDGLLRFEGVQHPTQLEDDAELLRREQDLLLARTGGIDVDGREDPLVRDATVELELRVAG